MLYSVAVDLTACLPDWSLLIIYLLSGLLYIIISQPSWAMNIPGDGGKRELLSLSGGPPSNPRPTFGGRTAIIIIIIY